jgi:hypothetical protein
MLPEGNETSTLIGARQISVLHFLLSADSEGREHFRECDGMLAIEVLYAMYGWKSRSSKSLKDSLPSVPARAGTAHASVHSTLQDQQLYPYRIQSVQESVCQTMHLQVCTFFPWTCNPTFTAKVLFTDESRFSWAGDMCGQMKILMQFDLGDCPICPHILPTRVGGHYCLIPFKDTLVDYWEMCPSIRVLTSGFFNTTVHHHNTALKWVNGFPKLSWTWCSYVSACALTWLESYRFFFLLGIFENQSLCHYSPH